MSKKIILSILVILFVGLAIAQVTNPPNFPVSFSITLTQLPQQQSSNQVFFGCPYGEIEHRVTNVYSNTGTQLAPVVDAEIKYWIKDADGNKVCAASRRTNFTLSASLSSNAIVTNFNDAINTYFQQEAQSNHQPLGSPNPIATGGSP